MKTGVAIQVLALEAQVLVPRFLIGHIALVLLKDTGAIQVGVLPLFLHRIAPSLVAGLPDDLALGVGELLRQAHRAVVEVVDLGQFRLLLWLRLMAAPVFFNGSVKRFVSSLFKACPVARSLMNC